MARWTERLALIVPVFLTWILAIVLTLSGFLEFVFLMVIVVPLFAIVAFASIALGMAYAVGRARGSDSGGLRLVGLLGLGLALSVVSFVISMFAAGPMVHAARQPIRTILAQRIIQRSHAGSTQGRTEITLRGPEALLADGGKVEVYPDGGSTSVLFWDWTGIMSGGASVYVENPDAAEPPSGLVDGYELHHDGGHWWTASEPE